MKLDQHPDFFTDDEPGSETVETTDSVETAGTAPASQSQEYEPEAKPRHRLRKFLIWFSLLLIVALGTAFYFRYISPYATDIKTTGTIYNVERRGIVFKTYECSVATTQALADTIHPYTRTDFSIADPAIADRLQKAQLAGIPVTITYSRYFGTLPWRGAYRNVITAVTPAN